MQCRECGLETDDCRYLDGPGAGRPPHWQRVVFWLALAAVTLGAILVVSSARADDWRPVQAGYSAVAFAQKALPTPQTPPASTPAPQRDDFGGPPSDGPTKPPDPVVPAPLVPETPTTVTTPGKAETTTTRKVEGGIIIDQHAAGTIVVNSPGVVPPAQAPQMQAQAFPVVPVLAAVTNPQVQSVVAATVRRVAKAGYVLVTGQCPPAAAPTVATAAAPQYYAMQPVQQTAYQMVPVAAPLAQPVYYAAPAPQPVYAAAPQYAPVPQYATPQALATPSAPAKCRLFSR